jgi:HAD superfamily hydrolase (TIGR01509 family)
MTPPDAQVQALSFDANGVLYHRIRQRQHLAQFLAHHAVAMPARKFIRQATRSIRDQATLGAVPREALFDAILEVCGVADADLRQAGRQALAADEATIALYEGVAATLYSLQARGVKLGIITNSATPTREKLRWFAACGLDLRWDTFVNSCEVGVRKPDLRIYEIALRRCAVLPSAAAFVGHDAADLAGASAAGMKTIAFQPTPDAQADMTVAHFADLLARLF